MGSELKLKTKRLILVPASDEEIEKLISSVSDPEEKKAYGEMLSGCREDPENRAWYAPWKLCLKKDADTVVGDICFKGPQQKGAVEIGYAMRDGYSGNGYMTEAVGALIEWAMTQTDVYTIWAETAPDNAASRRVLEKLKFVPGGEGEEGPRFKLEKEPTAWMALGMCFGISIGISFGSAFGNTAIGMCFGVSIGMMMGLLGDRQEKKHRQDVTGEEQA